MNKNLKIGIIAAGIILFIAFIAAGYIGYVTLGKNYEGQGLINESASSDRYKAPELLVTETAGKTFTLDDFKGKAIVLNFWTSWCPPCQNEMPNFNEVYLAGKEEVQFLMVALIDGNKEIEATALKFIKDKGYSFPIFFDKKTSSALNFSVSSIPTSVFIDKDGYVVDTHVGALSKAQLESFIQKIK